MRLKLRLWKESDAAFVCYMRNTPSLMRWYRQEEPISLEKQKDFIKKDTHYNGRIIELKGKPIGVFAAQNHGEISIVLEEKYFKYIPQLFNNKVTGCYWGEVFVGNPILKYLLEAGFKTHCVKERAYYKKEYGLIDIICIRK